MKNDSVWNSITRHLAGESSSEDELTLEKWTKQNRLNRGILDRLSEIWEYNPVQLTKSRRIYNAFKNRLNYHDKRQKETPFIYYAVSIVAILFLLIGTTMFVNNIIPLNKTRDITYNEISVPRGSRTLILLPDSSKVWISNGSRIKYPGKFAKDIRELDLTGEAYFEVTHDTKKPFIVNIGLNRIKALGTKFSVSAYPEDTIISADLLTGKIQLDINTGKGAGSYNSFLVKPAHSLVYHKTSGDITSSVIPYGFLDYWKDGIYKFNNESLESLARKIYRYYNVEIVFKDDYIKTKCFSGTISTDDNIFTFMEAIKRTSREPIDYRYENRTIYINLK